MLFWITNHQLEYVGDTKKKNYSYDISAARDEKSKLAMTSLNTGAPSEGAENGNSSGDTGNNLCKS